MVLPETVTRIEWGAFRSCGSLTGIVLPASLTYIGESAFEYCGSLSEVNLPDGLKTIESWAFNGCSEELSFVIPDSVSYIGGRAFDKEIQRCMTIDGSGAKALSRAGYWFMLPDNPTVGLQYWYENEEITGLAVRAANGEITEAEIPEGVTLLPDDAFRNCENLESIEIPGGIAAVSANAFAGCVNLTDATIASGVARIEEYAFANCHAAITIRIPNSVVYIDENAFGNDDEILVVGCVSYARTWATSHGYMLDAGTGRQYQIIHNELVVDPAVAPTCEETGLTEGNHCEACHEIPVPQEIVSALGHAWSDPIYTWSADHTAVTAERVCANDASHNETETAAATYVITASPTATAAGLRTWTSGAFDNSVFSVQQVTVADIPALNAMNALTLPAATGIVEAEAFEGGAFQCVVIPDGCATIGSKAFADCPNLIYVCIPASVTSVAADAFAGDEQAIIDRK